MSFAVHIEQDLGRDDVRLFVIHRPPGAARRGLLTSLLFSAMEPGEAKASDGYVVAPELGRQNELVQAIVDAAWAYGFRPTGEAGADGSQARHLEDMRALAFHALKAPKP